MEILIGIILGVLIVNTLTLITIIVTNQDEFAVYKVAVGLLMPIVSLMKFIDKLKWKKKEARIREEVKQSYINTFGEEAYEKLMSK